MQRPPHLKVLREALLLGPSLGVSASVVLHLLLVVSSQCLEAELASRDLLGSLLGGTVGVDGDASASGLGLLVLELSAVLVGDGHFGRWSCGL